MAIEHIRNGYPIIVIPKEYTDTILATGYSHQGRILKGIPFLDGDDEKKSTMLFQLYISYYCLERLCRIRNCAKNYYRGFSRT